MGGYYHQRLTEIYRFLVTPDQRVLEVGCGRGDLLAALKPAVGIGVDFSTEIVAQAARRHPSLQFIQADAHDLTVLEAYADAPFDVIILSDLLNDVWDVQTVLEQVTRWADSHTRIIINPTADFGNCP